MKDKSAQNPEQQLPTQTSINPTNAPKNGEKKLTIVLISVFSVLGIIIVVYLVSLILFLKHFGDDSKLVDEHTKLKELKLYSSFVKDLPLCNKDSDCVSGSCQQSPYCPPNATKSADCYQRGRCIHQATPSVPSSTSQQNQMVPADSEFPTAGTCLSADTKAQTVTITLPPDFVPVPRCAKVTKTQTLQIVNHSGKPLFGTLGQFTISIPADQQQYIDKPFGSYLAPGVHRIPSGAEIWVQP